MSTAERIAYLMDRCLHQLETPAERAELEDYYHDPQFQDNLQKAVLNSFYQEKPLVDITADKQVQMLTAIQQVEKPFVPAVKSRRMYGAWAAVAALLLLTLSPVLLTIRESVAPWYSHQEQLTVDSSSAGLNTEEAIRRKTTNPLVEMAVLDLADGSRIALEDLAVGSSIVHDNVVLERSKDGVLLLRFVAAAKKLGNTSKNYHTIRTAKGGSSKIVLHDGTFVQLNADSRLSFPTQFNDKERAVTLAGEAYFEVAKNRNQQFVVRSGQGKTSQEVRVYGTTFTISAYPEDDQIITTLLEGSVKVKGLQLGVERFIRPNELASLDAQGLKIGPADLESSLAWRDELFYFNKASISYVMKQLSRWYDIDVKYVGEIPDNKFWGQISRKKELTDLLHILEKTNQVKFEVKGKEVLVMSN